MTEEQLLKGLSPDVRAFARDYIARVRAEMTGAPAAVVEATTEDVALHFSEALDLGSTVEDAVRIAHALGDPGGFRVADARASEAVGAGTVLGVPYDVRVPTTARIAERWWDPRNPRVFVPRVFGIGWDVNFGALAVRLHLIEPDSEDEPFAFVPRRAFVAMTWLPVALTGAIAVSYALLAARMPAELPQHFDWAGRPDEFGSAIGILTYLLALAALPTVWAVVSVAVKRPALNQGAVLGFASFMSALSASIWAITLLAGIAGFTAWWLPAVSIVASFGVPLGVMAWLARKGRDVERLKAGIGGGRTAGRGKVGA